MTKRVKPHDAPRKGFTIIELVAAIVILSLGVLALAGTSALVSRTLGQGSQQSNAATVAQARFEKLRSTRCPVTSGSATSGSMNERWTKVATLGGANLRFYDVIDSVSYTVRGNTKRQAFRSIVQCLP